MEKIRGRPEFRTDPETVRGEQGVRDECGQEDKGIEVWGGREAKS